MIRAFGSGRFALGLALSSFLLTSCGGEGKDSSSRTEQTGPSSVASSPTAPRHEIDLAAAPNVILISIDTLRADHLKTYGYGRDTSPHIDALGAAGAVFETCASSSSWTLPAHAAMLTGLSDLVHGCTDTDRTLVPGRVTLAERLQAVGFKTGGFWSGPYLHPVFGLGQGFETWGDCTSYSAANDADAERDGTIEGESVWRRANDDITNPRVLKRAISWLEEHGDERFFLFLHMWDCHFDFIPPAPYDTMFDPDYTGSMTGKNFFFNPKINPDMNRRDLEHLKALYDGEIRWTDEHIGMLMDQLEAQGLSQNTLVVLTSDHGTAFFEHGQKAHRNALFDELIHVPLMMRYPGVIPTGLREDVQVRLIDIVPTILDLVGVPQPLDIMGRSLRPAFEGQLKRSNEPALSELYSEGQNLRSYRRKERKILMVWNDPAHPLSYVYDLERDPAEQKALSRPDLPLAQAALEDRQIGFEWLKRWEAALPVNRSTSEIPDDILKQLQGFGYVGSDGDH